MGGMGRERQGAEPQYDATEIDEVTAGWEEVEKLGEIAANRRIFVGLSFSRPYRPLRRVPRELFLLASPIHPNDAHIGPTVIADALAARLEPPRVMVSRSVSPVSTPIDW
jgi:hypothetical protein